MKLPVPLYGAAPPVALTVIVVVPPLHNMVPAEALAINGDNSAIVAVALAGQPLLSVIL